MDTFRAAHSPPPTRHRLIRLLVLALALAVAALLPFAAKAGVSVGIGVSVGYPPPPLPLYLQPPIPGPGYIWVPGYWDWDGDGYYWVPGYWEWPPYIGALWTPGYWGWFGGVYVFHAGYWARHVGFYGGINYGYGYPGHGYVGGRWDHGNFYYNRSVNQINDPHIANVYNGPVPNNGLVNRTSFNGGRGGVVSKPSPAEAAVARESHVAPTTSQLHQAAVAGHDPAMRVSSNHGAPLVTGVTQPAAARVVSAPRTPVGERAPNSREAMTMRSAGFAPHSTFASGVRPSPSTGASMHAAPSRFPTYAPTTGRTWSTNTMHPAPTYAYRPPSAQPVYHGNAGPAAPMSHPVRAPGGGSHPPPGNGHH